MPLSADLEFDAATVISQGCRDRQEDTIATDFQVGAGVGFAVLADGMGGHAAGDIASKIVVTEIFSDLKLRAGDPRHLESRIGAVLMEAAHSANDCLEEYANCRPESRGMGATLLAPVVFGNRLYWISVGDSPLYLFRHGHLARLNADHSMAARFDGLVAAGAMDRDEAGNHPDRHCVTSVLAGLDIPEIDCRATPLALQPGDIVIAASDGLQTLDDLEISAVLEAEQYRSSAEISTALMQQIDAIEAPEQDNVSIAVIKAFDPLQAQEMAPRNAQSAAAPSQPRPPGKRKITILASTGRRGGGLNIHSLSETIA